MFSCYTNSNVLLTWLRTQKIHDKLRKHASWLLSENKFHYYLMQLLLFILAVLPTEVVLSIYYTLTSINSLLHLNACQQWGGKVLCQQSNLLDEVFQILFWRLIISNFIAHRLFSILCPWQQPCFLSEKLQN